MFKDLGGSEETIDSFARAAAFKALNIAIREVPKDNSFLSKNISVEPNRFIAKAGVYAIKSNAFYSPYVEFGTGEKVDVPSELKSFAIQFKGEKKIIGQDAQPFLYPAALEGQKTFRGYLKTWIDKKTKSKL